eukprot:TRINITY_DN8842_c0_g1_i1.p1 TRINITY_DN8842_c0_g1~~TRINITY_DN8842_c0_g1_i1.p1  ORF type:complete len:371 (+),score=84.86 TRINITY_DN8842_c0_g1_i1:889-2001(+)
MMCATNKFAALGDTIERLHNEHPMYQVIVVGHSLGGGVAQLLTLLLLEAHSDWRIHCHAYGPACVLSENMAKHPDLQHVITSYVHNQDLVPRLSYGSLQALKLSIKELLSQSSGGMQRLVQYTQSFKAARLLQLQRLSGCTDIAAAASHSGLDYFYLDTMLPGGTTYLVAPAKRVVCCAEVASVRIPPLMLNIDANELATDPAILATAEQTTPRMPRRQKSIVMRSVAVGAEAADGTALDKKAGKRLCMVEVDAAFFSHVSMAESMFTDHLPNHYEAALSRIAECASADAADADVAGELLPQTGEELAAAAAVCTVGSAMAEATITRKGKKPKAASATKKQGFGKLLLSGSLRGSTLATTRLGERELAEL